MEISGPIGLIDPEITDSAITIESVKILGEQKYALYDNVNDKLYCDHLYDKKDYDKLISHIEDTKLGEKLCHKCMI
jgi:hypothetical protein